MYISTVVMTGGDGKMKKRIVLLTHSIALPLTTYPGCPEVVCEPGYCRAHSPKPHVEGMALSVQQAADEIGISRRGIYRLAASGKVNIKKIGGRSVILRRDIQKMVA